MSPSMSQRYKKKEIQERAIANEYKVCGIFEHDKGLTLICE